MWLQGRTMLEFSSLKLPEASKSVYIRQCLFLAGGFNQSEFYCPPGTDTDSEASHSHWLAEP